MVQDWWVDLCSRLGWHTEPHLLSDEMVRCKGVNVGGGQKQHVWLNWRENPCTPPIVRYTQPGWEDMIKPQGLRSKTCSLQILAANFQGLNRTDESQAPQKWHLLRNVAAMVGANIVLAQEMFSSKKKQVERFWEGFWYVRSTHDARGQCNEVWASFSDIRKGERE